MRFAHAKRDQDHIPYLLFNNPQIPDRTEYLLGGRKSPLPELIHTAKILKSAGATFIAIPCNTAQTFGKQVERAAGISVLNMVELTAKYILNTYGKHITVGLLATDGTIKSNIYQEEFEKLNAGISVITPSSRKQKNVMNAIYDIKSVSANEANSELLIDASRELVSQGASVIILGCTEIPLLISDADSPLPTLDSTRLLARAAVQYALR
jgi:aspartate racemase